MTSANLDSYFRSILNLDEYSSIDASLNGLQVDNNGEEISKIAFAVDACLETFKGAAAAGAHMLFVHHGLFWGENPQRVEGIHRERLKFLLDHNLALYAVHLPLDQHPALGNNAALAELLGITDREPFALYHGKEIGYKGKLSRPLTIDEAVKRVSFMNRPPLGVYPFGKQENSSCAVISGGGTFEALEAIREKIDLYITGDASHSIYHQALEGRLNMIAGGHYSTEVWGVRKVMEHCAAGLNLEVGFIDAPTGL
jgi:dinuclear metal center YbgI/SA1388 family protein